METEDKNKSIDVSTFKRMQRLYVLALSAIAFTIIFAQVLIQRHLNSQLSDSRVINIAGRQRAFSQKLVKEALLLKEYQILQDKQRTLDNLKGTIEVWKYAHKGLVHGNDSLGLPTEDDQEILSLFDEIKNPHNKMVSAAEHILAMPFDSLQGSSDEFQSHLDQLLDNERNFLSGMDKIVNEYDLRSKHQLENLKAKEYILLAFSILILLLEMGFIFRPLTKQIRKTIKNLIESQNQSAEDNAKIKSLYEENERSLNKLKELNFVIDNAALYASAKNTGELVYISKKFVQLLGLDKKNLNKSLAEVLTKDEGQQQYLREILKSNRRSIRTEEMEILTCDNQVLWLDISFVPMPGNLSEHSILLLCTDITEKKYTQDKVELLTKQRYEENLRQRQLNASQVVEGQEEERKRIAKDIHDGIGQMLTALKFNIESITPTNTEKTKERIELLKSLTSDLIKGVRTATFNLTPPELTDHGLTAAIQRMVSELTKLTGKNILFESQVDAPIRLDSLVETNLYRVTQEAINNAIKYSEASQILVRMRISGNMLSITVDDNGVGFDDKILSTLDQDPRKGGMGLFFMKERMSYINGRLFISSNPSRGTKVSINYNLPEMHYAKESEQ